MSVVVVDGYVISSTFDPCRCDRVREPGCGADQVAVFSPIA